MLPMCAMDNFKIENNIKINENVRNRLIFEISILPNRPVLSRRIMTHGESRGVTLCYFFYTDFETAICQ